MRGIRNIALGLLVATGLFLFLDLFLFSASIVDRSITDFDVRFGRVRPQNKTYICFNEGFGIGKFNAGRYIGDYVPKLKSSADFRIAILGDSFVEGFQVFERHSFPYLLECKLNAISLLNYSTLNFGRSGFDIEDMIIYNELYVRDYRSDLTLYFLTNDDYYPEVTDVLIPTGTFDEDSLLIRKDFPELYLNRFQFLNRFALYSSYFNMLKNCIKLFDAGFFWQKMLDNFYKEEKLSSSQNYIENKTCPPKTTKLLNFLASKPGTIIVHSSEENMSPEIQEIVHSLKIPVIDIGVVLDSLKKNGIDPTFWNVTGQKGHWNQKSHAAIAEYLTDQLFSVIDESD